MKPLHALERAMRLNINLNAHVFWNRASQQVHAHLEEVNGGKDGRFRRTSGVHTTLVGALLIVQARLGHHKAFIKGPMETELDATIKNGWMLDISPLAGGGFEGTLRLGTGSLMRSADHITDVIEALGRRTAEPVVDDYYLDHSKRVVFVSVPKAALNAPSIPMLDARFKPPTMSDGERRRIDESAQRFGIVADPYKRREDGLLASEIEAERARIG